MVVGKQPFSTAEQGGYHIVRKLIQRMSEKAFYLCKENIKKPIQQ